MKTLYFFHWYPVSKLRSKAWGSFSTTFLCSSSTAQGAEPQSDARRNKKCRQGWAVSGRMWHCQSPARESALGYCCFPAKHLQHTWDVSKSWSVGGAEGFPWEGLR